MHDRCWDVVIVGAGMTGLAARKELLSAGLNVLTLEKSRGLGGRMATRRTQSTALHAQQEAGLSDCTDLGAQFVSARGAEFSALLERTDPSLLGQVQIEGSSRHPRYIHREGMSQLAKLCLEDPLDDRSGPILKQTRVIFLRREKQGTWKIETENGQAFSGKSVLVTAPLPQSLELLKESNLTDPELSPGNLEDDWAALKNCEYSTCICVIFELAADSGIEKSGILKNVAPQIEGIFDQKQKGLRTSANTLVVHASADASRALWEKTDSEISAQLWQACLGFLPAYTQGKLPSQPRSATVKKWRFCEPFQVLPRPFFCPNPMMWLAGDAFEAARVEGAFDSGKKAARSIVHMLSSPTSKAIQNALNAETQAIAIYEAEIFWLRRSQWTSSRKTTLRLCEDILREERDHSASLNGYLACQIAPWKKTLSRQGGYALGTALALLPTFLSALTHAWAEKQASQIYRSTRDQMANSTDPALLHLLQRAEKQELEHSQRFAKLLAPSF